MENLTKSYIVTLDKGVDIQQFYNEMETPGGSLNVPDRKVECYDRRPISRNTGYILTNEEVENLKNDSRVIGVESQELLDSIIIKPAWTQTSSDWNKTVTNTNTNRNWGLLRCIEGSQRSGWGIDAGGSPTVSGTAVTTSSGKNVDVLIVDGHLDENHPEFAVNEDGTGGSRVVEYNWFQHNAQLGLGSNSTYVYPSGSALLNGDDNHGMHVAGTVAGNTQGWARDSNIFSISPYSTNPNTIDSSRLFEYVRAWHNNKTVNSATGRRNPTILNNSWVSQYTVTRSAITSINYRGSAISPSPTFSDSDLSNVYGMFDYDVDNIYIHAYIASWVADIEDAVSDGIIFVGAAGNEYTRVDVVGGLDYNNYVVKGGYSYYYHRGSWQSAAATSSGVPVSVCVGASDIANIEKKAIFSNCGPRINIYAPGYRITSSLHSDGGGLAFADDSRNSNYKMGKFSGTSMASPQVCGVLACLLEQYPNMKQSDIMSYLSLYSKESQLDNSAPNAYNQFTSLQGGVNKYLFYKKERTTTGMITSKLTSNVRKTSGMMFPRSRFI